MSQRDVAPHCINEQSMRRNRTCSFICAVSVVRHQPAAVDTTIRKSLMKKQQIEAEKREMDVKLLGNQPAEAHEGHQTA